jgi:hypothetical protein
VDASRAATFGRLAAGAVDGGPRRTATGRQATMKAVVQGTYGSTEVLQFRNIDVPVPKDDEVLVRVHAAGLDRGVWHVMTGLPYLIRFVVPTLGLRKPKLLVRGMDLAGRVEAAGEHVTRFQPGDAVFGWSDGSYAEYASAPEDHLAAKPTALSFEQAAAVPISAFAALQGLRDVGGIHAGQRVLVIGAAGGVGSFAVQLAKAFGADVTGVGSTTQLELLRSIGADEVVDYTREDVTDGRRHWDLILDTAATVRCPSSGVPSPTGERWSSSAAKGEDGGSEASTATCGRSCCPGSWASGCGCWAPSHGRTTCKPCGNSSRPARSRRSSTGRSRCGRSPRPSGTYCRATDAARSSSPCEAQSAGAR